MFKLVEHIPATCNHIPGREKLIARYPSIQDGVTGAIAVLDARGFRIIDEEFCEGDCWVVAAAHGSELTIFTLKPSAEG